MSSVLTGQTVLILAGQQVTRRGVRVRQQRDTIVTVRNTAPARNNKTRIFWKSGGYAASALV